MQFDASLTGDAGALARTHAALLSRLPATVQAFIILELQKWPALFGPEQRYQRALLEHLAGLPGLELSRAMAGIARVETEAGCDKIARGNPARFQDEAQALLRKRRLLPEWRKEVDALFRQVDPILEAHLYLPGAPRRLVVQIYSSGIAIQSDKLWQRFKGTGIRVPLSLKGSEASEPFLRALFGGREAGGTALFAAVRAAEDTNPLHAWIVESQDALHALCDRGAMKDSAGDALAGLSYDRLRPYRDELTRALYSKIQTGVESPQAFAAYARSLKITPAPGALLYTNDLLLTFVRDVLLTGNGTLFVNNTFVEWAAVQALRRAQPRVLVTRFGVRDKLKPFSSLLLFSQPRASDQIPLIEDPVGSFIDVEQLSYYVWLNAEKSAAYRKKTLYLFLAEGIDEMLAVRSDVPTMTSSALPAASLSDVCATMAQWLGVTMPESTGRAITALVG
jgi:hypothetical protein